MDKKRRKVAVFHNLPEGGGMRMLGSILNRYKKTHSIDLFVIAETLPVKVSGIKANFVKVKPWRGFLFRNLWILFKLPKIHRDLSKIINSNYDQAIVTHDYFTKSPYLLKYLTITTIYLCQEPQREFYEPPEIHAPGLKEKLANILRYPIKIVDESNVNNADNIVCNSQYSNSILKKVYGKKCEIVYPGVDEKKFRPVSLKKDKMILCVGGINPVKDQLFLVKAVKPLLDSYRLILVGQGKGDYVKKIMNEIEHSTNIEIIQKVTDKKLIDLYCRAMVVCISAHNEPFGLSSIESQSCGTPVVSVQEGGPAETIIEGKTGYLVERNTLEYRKKVLLAIKNHKKMGRASRRNIVNHWTWNETLKIFDKYMK